MTTRRTKPHVFSQVPNEGDAGLRYTILRVPPKGLSGPLITSHEPIGLYTHWINSRTVPCKLDNCKFCEENAQRRWYGYVMVFSQKVDRQYLFEYTAAAAQTLKDYFDRYRTCRGAKLEAIRQGARVNGRVTLYLRPPVTDQERLPKAPNRIELLSKMWGVDLTEFWKDKQAPPISKREATQQELDQSKQ